MKQAHVVIDNDSDVEKTWKQVQTQWNEIRKVLTSSPQKTATGTTVAVSPNAAPIDDGMGEPETITVEGLKVKRGMPNNAQGIADFITAHGKRGQVSRMDVMMSFGQKSYLLAQDDKDDVLAIIGWTVENLVTRMDEFHIKPGIPVPTAVHAILTAVEDASKDLNSEAAFIFLPSATANPILEAFKADGYATITLKEIKIPVWREAVEEALRDSDRQVLWKQLRKDRVLQPI